MTVIQRGQLSKYFDGVAVKKLSVVETTPKKSNQHEFNGAKVLRELLGEAERRRIPTRFIWFSSENEGVTDDGFLSWYDSRKKKVHRNAEYRLYYLTNSVSGLMKAGDTLFLALRPDGTAMVIIAASGSTIQSQLLWMFGVDEPELQFTVKEIGSDFAKSDFALRYILDELGIEPEEPESDKLDRLLAPFGNKFPSTRVFSALARKSLRHINALDDPDAVLMAWLEREELLFRRLERKLVSDRLNAGFSIGGVADVDGFLRFSLHVQNRRKSRAGQSLENQLEALFLARNIKFERGVETENKNRPDFLFPGGKEYQDRGFPDAHLLVLGAKSTCKDRWRQVLSEAKRIKHKHLLTLEPGISENQTDEMQAKKLQLILPARLHETYREKQRAYLMNLSEFIELAHSRQASVLS